LRERDIQGVNLNRQELNKEILEKSGSGDVTREDECGLYNERVYVTRGLWGYQHEQSLLLLTS